MKRAVVRLATALWVPVSIVILAEALNTLVQNPFFPPPSEVFSAFEVLRTAVFWENSMFPTLDVLFTGFFAGSFGGLLAGAVAGATPLARATVFPSFVFIRSIPTAAKLPVILGIVGIGSESLYIAVALSTFLNVFVTTVIAVGRIPSGILDSARVLQLGWFRTLFQIKFPAVIGEIATGLQAALQVAILVTVLVETLASGFGLGSFLQNGQNSFQFSQLWVGIILLGLIGVLLNEAFHVAERKLIPWFFATRASR